MLAPFVAVSTLFSDFPSLWGPLRACLICTSALTTRQGDMWSLGCALFKWTTGKEFAYLAAGARLHDMLHLVPPSFGNKVL